MSMRWFEERKSLLFLKKKKQKDFYPFAPVPVSGHGARCEKFFGSFFQKRTAFFGTPHA
jgi:hypothetical protein